MSARDPYRTSLGVTGLIGEPDPTDVHRYTRSGHAF
jgi:hypothetical protein